MDKKTKDKIYGNRIRQILAERNMTNQELSDLSGVTTPHLSRIINGQRRCISLPTAIKISLALQMPVEKIFNYQSVVEE